MEKERKFIKRIKRLAIFAAAAMIFMAAYILYLPKQDNSNESTDAMNISYGGEIKIKASRGEIYDRNGIKLVSNRSYCSLTLNYVYLNKSRSIETYRQALKLTDEIGVRYKDSMPVSYYPYIYTDSGSKFKSFLRNYGLREDLDANDAMEALCTYYGFSDYKSAENRRIIGLIYDLYSADFPKTTVFTLAKDIDRKYLTAAASTTLKYPAIRVEMQSEREVMTEYAAHILGRCGSIPQGQEENYVDYSLDALVGLDGAEYAFEELLRGYDGLCSEDIMIKRAKSGSDVYLTIDIELQKAAEDSLAETIEEIKSRGIKAEGGAAAVVDINNGEILALASYPSYSINTYSNDYVNKSTNPLNPLFNRATGGTYAPGSTFKMVTAAAALESGSIEADTEIECQGIYDYYSKDYVYHCWLYRDTGKTHGIQTVSSALANSCNCFFYEIGRLTGIDTIELWAIKFGFGQKTGIELGGEAVGTVAGRVERALSGGDWYAGDTLNASIGQSDTLVTPLQLANYMAALCSNKLCQPHILLCAKYKDKTVKSGETKIIREIEMSDETKNVITEGLKAVTTDGTAESVFADSKIEVLAKSGSAQVSDGDANSIFVLAAPADNPQIAVAVVIEHGASGTNSARVAKAIAEAWQRRQRLSKK